MAYHLDSQLEDGPCPVLFTCLDGASPCSISSQELGFTRLLLHTPANACSAAFSGEGLEWEVRLSAGMLL